MSYFTDALKYSHCSKRKHFLIDDRQITQNSRAQLGPERSKSQEYVDINVKPDNISEQAVHVIAI